ncbi:hypothetical protein EVAR_61716_1 [Eumeta japonica]|uniref:Uncharacterized protein n=1 Tax=Eumeta variegata TaxID=151549 RepID=A0A4C1ZNY9_EUMVA|nr:hypothetical protein EVAR_61716_1 [Eumeta japonica]
MHRKSPIRLGTRSQSGRGGSSQSLPPKDDLDPITQDEISKHIKGLEEFLNRESHVTSPPVTDLLIFSVFGKLFEEPPPLCPLINKYATGCKRAMMSHGTFIIVSVYLPSPKQLLRRDLRSLLALGDAVIHFDDFNCKKPSAAQSVARTRKALGGGARETSQTLIRTATNSASGRAKVRTT